MATQGVDPIEFMVQIVTTFPFNLIIVLGVVGYILYYVYSNREAPEEKFQIEDFRETVFGYHEKLMDAFGIETDSYLVRGIELQGKIDKWYPLIQDMPNMKIDKKSNSLVEVKKKAMSKTVIKDEKKASTSDEINAIIFQIGKKSMFSFLTGHKPKFVILETKSLTFDSDSKKWGMAESISLIPYANVFIASDKTEKWINNISFMRSQEEVLTYSQNFARKTAWLELAHVKLMDYVLGKEDKKRAGWEGYRRKALGYEEEDDGD